MNAHDYWTRRPALITLGCSARPVHTISPARPQAAWAARLDDLAGPPARLSDGEAESDAVRLPGWSGLRSPDPGFGVRTPAHGVPACDSRNDDVRGCSVRLSSTLMTATSHYSGPGSAPGAPTPRQAVSGPDSAGLN